VTGPANRMAPLPTLHRATDRATLTLVAPPGKPPTLDHDSLAALDTLLGELAAQPPRLLVVRSDSPKYFCVGANVRALATLDADSIGAWVRLGHRVFNRLADLPCPVVARVAGYAMGGGLELALSCDLIYAADDARFAQSEARLGFIPGWGGTHRLVRRVGVAQAKRLFFSGATLDAPAAHALGLADRVEPSAGLDAVIDEFAAAVGANNPYALATFKRIVDDDEAAARARCVELESELSRACCADPDARSRLHDFLAKRK
jgi:enoyl-CoA hydratase